LVPQVYSKLQFLGKSTYKLLKKGTAYVWTSKCSDAFSALKDSLLKSEALAFPRFDLEFRLAVYIRLKGIGYMLYQIHEDGKKACSKGLSKWQHPYGQTKLELLGLINSVLDCAISLRGRHFIIECDHQALKPLFQKQLRGAIYERWLAILQQFDCDIQWKSASQMVVPDTLSRMPSYPGVLSCSPEEEDMLFPYVPEKPTTVKLKLHENDNLLLNKMDICAHQSDLYDADTEDTIDNDSVKYSRKFKFRRTPYKSRIGKTTKTFNDNRQFSSIKLFLCVDEETDNPASQCESNVTNNNHLVVVTSDVDIPKFDQLKSDRQPEHAPSNVDLPNAPTRTVNHKCDTKSECTYEQSSHSSAHDDLPSLEMNLPIHISSSPSQHVSPLDPVDRPDIVNGAVTADTDR
jgi:hypothetical protein